MNFKVFFASLALVSLSACGGGGGGSSSTPTVFSPVGTFAGTVVNPQGTEGAMALRVDSTGSGEFDIQYPNSQAVDLSFPSNIAQINGDTFNLSGQFIVGGVSTNCPFSLHGTMSSANEMDGSFSLGDNTGNCGAPVTITFRVVRTATVPQAFAKQHPSKTLF